MEIKKRAGSKSDGGSTGKKRSGRGMTCDATLQEASSLFCLPGMEALQGRHTHTYTHRDIYIVLHTHGDEKSVCGDKLKKG